MGKATEHLLGEEIKAEYLNARRIGRVLDKLYDHGMTTIFMTIAVEVVKKFGVSMTSVHGDSSSFYLHGFYESGESEITRESNFHVQAQLKVNQEMLRAYRTQGVVSLSLLINLILVN